MDYPTSYRRRQGERGSGGFPTGTPLLALGGFLAPATEAALAALAAAEEAATVVEVPILPAMETISTSVARSSLSGFTQVVARGAWPLAIAATAYALYRAWQSYGPVEKTRISVPPGWVLTQDCGFEPTFWTSQNAACGVVGNFGARGISGPLATNQQTFYTAEKLGNVLDGTILIVARTAQRYDRPALPLEERTPSFLTETVWKYGRLDIDLAPDWARRAPYDPFSVPVGAPMQEPISLPFRVLPYRQQNPWRSPMEQSQRGYAEPLREWEPINLDEIDTPPLKRTVVAPGEAVPSDTVWEWPSLDPRLPANVPAPVGSVTLDPVGEAPPVREEFPEGAAGPTITIGGGPPIGSHDRAPPGKREKERKAKHLGVGGWLLIKSGVNPVTEALEVLDCLYSSLPKKVRWDIQREDWKAQRAKAKSEGRTLSKAPAQGAQSGPKIDLGQLSDGLKGHSITLPGGTKAPQYARLGVDQIHALSPQAKASAVYRHFDKVDLAETAKCIGANEIEDRIFGKLGSLSGKAAKKNGWSHGLGTGPLF